MSAQDGSTRPGRRLAGSGRSRGGAGRSATLRAAALAAVLSVAAAFALAACSIGGGSGELPGVGERAANEATAVIVHSITFYDEVTADDGSPITPQSDGDVFTVVDMTIKNTGTETQHVNPEDVRLVRVGGDYATGSSAAETAFLPKEFTALKNRPLGPGKKVRGMVAFVLPKGTKLEKLMYMTDPEIEVSMAGTVAKAPKPERPPGIGETARAGGLALTVRSVTYPTELVSGLWTTTAKAGSRLVVVDLAVKNLDNRPSFTVNPLDVSIVDQKGKLHITGSIIMGMAESEKFQVKKLKPGAQESGKVVISLSKRLKVERIRFAVGVMGPPLEVAARR